jgi:soluble lytic murein transglycosylase-like protein
VPSIAESPQELVALAKQKADAHQLYPELVCAICEQESSWNSWSIRYEPGFYEKYVAPLWLKAAIKTLTEAQARSFSWGLMQVMGQTAREHGFDGPFLSALCAIQP